MRLFEDRESPSTDQVLAALAIAEAHAENFRQTQHEYTRLKNPYLQSTIMVAVAATTPQQDVLHEWLQRATQLRVETRCRQRALQPLLAALVRRAKAETAIDWVRQHEGDIKPLTEVRAKLGIAQGVLGIVPGKKWLELLDR